MSPSAFVELGLRVAQVYEVQLDNVNEAVARYRRVLELGPGESERGALARPPVHADRALEQTWRRSSRARPTIGQTPEEILEFKYRLGQVYQTRLGDRGSRRSQAYREVISAAPEHTGHAARARGVVRVGHAAARTVARSSSRCIRRPRSGRS